MESYKPAPIMTFEERTAVVEGCRFIDGCCEERRLFTAPPNFWTKTARCMLSRRRYDRGAAALLVRGSGVEGGRLKVVSYTPNISTRLIVARIGARVRAEAPGS